MPLVSLSPSYGRPLDSLFFTVVRMLRPTRAILSMRAPSELHDRTFYLLPPSVSKVSNLRVLCRIGKASHTSWRRLPPCPLVITLVPLKCSSKNLQFPHGVPLINQGENALVPLPFQTWSIKAWTSIFNFSLKADSLQVHVLSSFYDNFFSPCEIIPS